MTPRKLLEKIVWDLHIDITYEEAVLSSDSPTKSEALTGLRQQREDVQIALTWLRGQCTDEEGRPAPMESLPGGAYAMLMMAGSVVSYTNSQA